MHNTGRRSGGGTGGVVSNNAQNGLLIHSNLFYDIVKGPGVDVFGSGNVGTKVYNNTIVGSPGCISVGSNNGASGAIVKNNICKNNSGAITVYSGSTNATVQNNIIHGGGTFTNSGSGTIFTAAITGDPKLSNIGTHDFHLLAGSSAIDAGQNLTATVPLDYGQTTYTVPMEIGAYNYGTQVTPLHLAFLTQPSSTLRRSPFTVVVQILDSAGLLQTSFSNTVTIVKASGTGTLTGTTTCTPSGGSCTFSTLVLDTPGTFTLSVSATGAAGATSTAFTVTSPAVPPAIVTNVQTPSRAVEEAPRA